MLSLGVFRPFKRWYYIGNALLRGPLIDGFVYDVIIEAIAYLAGNHMQMALRHRLPGTVPILDR